MEWQRRLNTHMDELWFLMRGQPIESIDPIDIPQAMGSMGTLKREGARSLDAS